MFFFRGCRKRLAEISELRLKLDQQDEQWLALWTAHEAALKVIERSRAMAKVFDMLARKGNRWTVQLGDGGLHLFDPAQEINEALDAYDRARLFIVSAQHMRHYWGTPQEDEAWKDL